MMINCQLRKIKMRMRDNREGRSKGSRIEYSISICEWEKNLIYEKYDILQLRRILNM